MNICKTRLSMITHAVNYTFKSTVMSREKIIRRGGGRGSEPVARYADVFKWQVLQCCQTRQCINDTVTYLWLWLQLDGRA